MYLKSFVVVFIAILISSCSSNLEKSHKYYDAGLEEFHYREYKLAISNFEKSLEYDSENYEAYFYIGNCLMNQGKYQLAIEEFTKAIETHPKYADAFANRGHAYFYLNDIENSCADYLEADELGKPNMEDKIRHCK